MRSAVLLFFLQAFPLPSSIPSLLLINSRSIPVYIRSYSRALERIKLVGCLSRRTEGMRISFYSCSSVFSGRFFLL